MNDICLGTYCIECGRYTELINSWSLEGRKPLCKKCFDEIKERYAKIAREAK